MGQMEDIFDLYNKGASKGQSILNSIFGLPTSEGIDAQKQLMDYEQHLWRERAEYDSYEERMKRLREAGLNPDLVVGQGMGSGQVPNMPSTTQLGHGASGVPAMMNSLTNAALASSQIDANQAKAEKDRADAGKTTIETDFLHDTFGVRVDMLSESLGLKVAERKLLQTQVDTFAAYAEQAMASVNYMRQLSMTETWNTRKVMHESRFAASSADIMAYRNQMFPQFQDAELREIISRANLNDKTSAKLFQETRFLVSSFEDRLNNLSWEGFGIMQKGFADKYLQRYYQAYDDFLQTEIQFYPLKVIGGIVNDPKYLKTDKEGNIVRGKDGMPLINQGYKATKAGLDIAGDVMGLIKDGAMAYGSLRFGIGFNGKSATFVPAAPAAPAAFKSKPKAARSATGKENDMFNSWVYDAKSSNSDLEKVFQRIADYKKKHNIE